MKIKNLYKIAPASILLCSLFSCSQESAEMKDLAHQENSDKLNISTLSRSFISGDNENLSFNANDSIGIFMFNENTSNQISADINIYNNKYLLRDNQWNNAEKRYWPDEESKSTMIVYKPYVKMLPGTSAALFPIIAYHDQSTPELLNKANFCYGKAEHINYKHNKSDLSIVLKRKLAALHIKLILPEGANLDMKNGATIENTVRYGSINLNNGEILLDKLSTDIDIKPYYDKENKTLKCFVLPQTFPAGKDLVIIRYTNKENKTIINAYKTTQPIEFISNSKNEIELTLHE